MGIEDVLDIVTKQPPVKTTAVTGVATKKSIKTGAKVGKSCLSLTYWCKGLGIKVGDSGLSLSSWG